MRTRGGQRGTLRLPVDGWDAGAENVREVCSLRDRPSPDARPWRNVVLLVRWTSLRSRSGHAICTTRTCRTLTEVQRGRVSCSVFLTQRKTCTN